MVCLGQNIRFIHYRVCGIMCGAKIVGSGLIYVGQRSPKSEILISRKDIKLSKRSFQIVFSHLELHVESTKSKSVHLTSHGI